MSRVIQSPMLYHFFMANRTEFKRQAFAIAAIAKWSSQVKMSNTQLDKAVAKARDLGLPWADIAEAADMVPSSAWERWSERGQSAEFKASRARPQRETKSKEPEVQQQLAL